MIRPATQQIDAAELVPGDLVLVEAGDIVPADGRIVRSASLETQEAALTGERARREDPSRRRVALGDRTHALQNTSVTRGSPPAVTATGMTPRSDDRHARRGHPDPSPLQTQLDDLTKKIAFVAWGALAIILVVGLIRGLSFADLMLLGISMAISAIPTGLPTFVQSMLAVGAKQLAAAKAIVRGLADVETLGPPARSTPTRPAP